MMARAIFQQKDAGYKPFPLGYSFFGGALENGETPEEGCRREVAEELSHTVSEGLGSLTQVFSDSILGPRGPFHFTLFQAQVSQDLFDQIVAMDVKEGLTAVCFSRSDFPSLKLIWGLEITLASYL